MAIFSTLKKKQVHNGIFIAFLMLFAAGIAAWWFTNRGGDTVKPDEHPLTQAATIESLCGLIPKFVGTESCADSEPQPNIAGHSVWSDANGTPVVRMDVITTRNLSVAGPMTSQAWLDSVLPEIKASGRLDWAEPIGAWSKAAITRKDNEQELLFEDNGIVVVMQSRVVERELLLQFAEQTAKALRNAKPVISSQDAATQKWTPVAPEKP